MYALIYADGDFSCSARIIAVADSVEKLQAFALRTQPEVKDFIGRGLSWIASESYPNTWYLNDDGAMTDFVIHPLPTAL